MNICDIIENELLAETKFKEACKEVIKHSPRGSLLVNVVNNVPYYSIRQAGRSTPEYQGKNITTRIEALQIKRFCQEAVKVLEGNIKELSRAKRIIKPYDPDSIITHMPKSIQEFPNDCYEIMELINAKRWEKTPYPQFAGHKENLRHITNRGETVRSKNELLICNGLFNYGIPYMYEPELIIDGNPYHPDAVAYSWAFQKLFYWEHLGLVGDSGYLQFNDEKLRIYREYGIVPWQNLIVTYDDENGDIDSRIIDRIIKLWLVGQ